MTTPHNTIGDRPIDPLLQHRLDQLIARAPLAAGSAVSPAPRLAGRRAKPARAAKLSALALSTVSTVMLAGLFAQHADNVDSIGFTTGTISDPVLPTATTAQTTPATVAATAPDTLVADGAYAGIADSNRWGNVQVQVVYSSGQITDVQIVQYPDGDNKSVRINARALPTLISESISAQRADVSTVSGATYTSVSYRVSLQSAIDNAKAAMGVGS